jgi:hypothetical protein
MQGRFEVSLRVGTDAWGDQGHGRKPEQSVPPSRPATVSAPAPPTPLDPPMVLQVDDTRSTASKVLAGSNPVLDLFGSGASHFTSLGPDLG